MTAALLIVSALAVSSARSGVAHAASPLPGAVQGACPRLKPEALPGDALIGATGAALHQARSLYRDLNLTGMRATEAVLAPFNSARGGYARKCGHAVYARTVVVELEFPAMKPSASLSQGVVLVSRFAGRYRVWALLH